MELKQFSNRYAEAVIQLFTDVFSDSEGRAEGDLIGNLAAELLTTTKPGDIYGFIALEQQSVIGCVLFTRLIFESNSNVFLLSPAAVSTGYQQQGIGKQLIQFSINDLKQHHVDLLLTYGDPAFYSKVGFQQLTEAVIKAPFKLSQPQGWQALSLSGQSVDTIRGIPQCVSALCHPKYW